MGENTNACELSVTVVVRRRLLQQAVTQDVVLDPELRVEAIDERVDHVPGSPADDPETIYQATLKAFAAGAHGIVISREDEEMKVEHLRAVGQAVREVRR